MQTLTTEALIASAPQFGWDRNMEFRKVTNKAGTVTMLPESSHCHQLRQMIMIRHLQEKHYEAARARK